LEKAVRCRTTPEDEADERDAAPDNWNKVFAKEVAGTQKESIGRDTDN